MKTLSFLSVAAATALSSAGAGAQPAGVSWQHAPGPMPMPPADMRVQRRPMQAPPPPMAAPQPHGPMRTMDGGRPMMQPDGGPRMHHPRAGRFVQYHRLDRGAVLPQRWWGPQFQIWNWHMYGLPQPIPGGRWIRYHDDALLIDRDGRIRDGRWDMRWDDRDDDRFYDGPDEEWDRGPYDYDESCRCLPPMPPTYYQPGFMWVSPGMVTVTETTTTPTVVYETVYVKEKARPHWRAKPKYRAKPRPVPPGPGERG